MGGFGARGGRPFTYSADAHISSLGYLSKINSLYTPRGVGGGGYPTKFCTRRLRPELLPVTVLYTILTEIVPLSYTFY